MTSQATDSRRQAFTLMEMMIAISIIGLLAILAIPAMRKAHANTLNTAFVNDLRVLSQTVFEPYALAKGDFPAGALPGVEPAGIHEYLPRHFNWAEDTPIGGKWDWNRATNRQEKVDGYYAALGVVGPDRTSTQMREIDRKMDDGNLLTGRFQTRGANYYWILEEH